jgi:hypothetical protein
MKLLSGYENFFKFEKKLFLSGDEIIFKELKYLNADKTF